MDWHKITERTEYVSVDESLIGIYHLSGNGVVLIDAGAAEWPEFLDDIISRGLEVKAILCSHLHFDHMSDMLPMQYALQFHPRAEALPVFAPSSPEKVRVLLEVPACLLP